MSRALQGRRSRSVSVHGCEDQRETKSAVLNKLPKKFPTHSGARGWLRRCSDWWALPGRPAPLAQGVPMAPSCPWQPSWRLAWAQSLLLSRRGSGGSTLHTKTHGSRTPMSSLVEGALPLGSGVHARHARRCGWPARGLHCMPTSEISSHPLSLGLGSSCC